jgi:hypothetical protein
VKRKRLVSGEAMISYRAICAPSRERGAIYRISNKEKSRISSYQRWAREGTLHLLCEARESTSLARDQE